MGHPTGCLFAVHTISTRKELRTNYVTNNVKSLADERDALFTRLFAGRAEATRELGRQYMLAADEAGKWDSERR